MSPRSLLFSSSEETSRHLAQALLELDFAVDSCREIFAALEQVSTRSYDLIVVDGKDGAEAAFLLKIAQESKRKPAPFTVVLEDAGAGGTSRDVGGAALFLHRPFQSEQVKYDLLACDAFLAAMRSWFSPREPEADQALPGAPAAQTKAFDTRHSLPVLAELRSAAHAIDHSPLVTRPPVFGEADGFDPFEDVDASPAGPSTLQSLFETANAEAQSRPRRGPFIPLSLCIGLGAALLFTDYLFNDDPWLGKVANASSTLLLSAAKSKILAIHPSPRPALAAKSHGSTPQGRSLGHGENNAWVRVTEVRGAKEVRPGAPSSNDLIQDADVPAPEVQTSSSPDSPASLRPAAQQIPESLIAVARPPGPEADLPAGVGTRVAHALLPVKLSEELADQLLLEKPQPSYPERALKAGLQGSVVLEALIGTDGVIRDLKLLSGPLLLGKAACEAVKQWRYKPLLRNGHAVEAQTLVTINFKLP
jgi:TonB family protein